MIQMTAHEKQTEIVRTTVRVPSFDSHDQHNFHMIKIVHIQLYETLVCTDSEIDT